MQDGIIPDEIWRDIPGYGGTYQVSNLGQILSARRRVRRLLAGWIDSNGYRAVGLTRPDGSKGIFRVHQLVMETFAGPPGRGQEIRHLNGDKLDNRWAPGDEEAARAAGGNLIYGTHIRNMADSILHGTHISLDSAGEKNGRAKLTERQVAEIRARYAAGRLRQQDLADEYGVSQVKISQVVTGKNWKAVSGPLKTPDRSRKGVS